MSNKLRKLAFSVLLGSVAVVAVSPPAHANRGTYTPTPPVENSEDPDVETEVLGSNEQAPAPVVTDPGADVSGTNDPAPLVMPQVNPVSDPGPAPSPVSDVAPENAGSALPRTGATILPLAQAGMAVLTLGLGLVVLARRRRAALAQPAA